MAEKGQIRIGTSGWIYPHWRKVFYPPDLPVQHWFSFYARHFDTVEINNTFYRLPGSDTFAEWRRQAPQGFLYAVKASRYLTHLKKLKDPVLPLKNLLGRARKLGPSLGPILYQLPPRWRCNLDRLQEFLSLLSPRYGQVLEFRDPSWCNEQVRHALASHRVGYCIHDMPGFSCPDWVTGPEVYIRFHGPTGEKYAGRYNRGHLKAWAEKVRQFAQAGLTVFVYFNNDHHGNALFNAGELKDLLAPALTP